MFSRCRCRGREGRAGQGRAGQGRAGQGRAGQGRAGQGRAGQGSTHTTPSVKMEADLFQSSSKSVKADLFQQCESLMPANFRSRWTGQHHGRWTDLLSSICTVCFDTGGDAVWQHMYKSLYLPQEHLAGAVASNLAGVASAREFVKKSTSCRARW